MIRAIKWWVFLAVGFYINAVLTILPLSMASQWYRPQWIFMFVIFCQLMQPRYFNPMVAWCLGLLVDSLLGTPLGEYALVCAMIAYLTSLLRASFFRRPMWLQIEKVLLLVCFGQIIILWFHAFAGHHPHTLAYWLGSVSSALLWPVFVGLLRPLTPLVVSHHTR